jgi:hypothetical protein
MAQPRADNEAKVTVWGEDLAGSVLGRVVGMLAARAQCPIDRLDDALLVTDAVAAHAGDHGLNGAVQVTVSTAPDGLALLVGSLREGGAAALVAAAQLPGVGNVLEHMADEVSPGNTDDGAGEQLLIRLRFAP